LVALPDVAVMHSDGGWGLQDFNLLCLLEATG